MRTTLSLDADVIDKARAVAAKRHAPFRAVINEALRAGLVQVEKPPRRLRYRTRPRAMGLRPGFDLDNIQELLAHLDGESTR